MVLSGKRSAVGEMTEVHDEITRGLDHFVSESLEPFDCKKCGESFTPSPGQWIFYNLCDGCFRAYNSAKMDSRLGRGIDLLLSEWLGGDEEQ